VVARVEVAEDGLTLRGWVRRRQIAWGEIDRILLAEGRGTLQSMASSKPGGIYRARVLTILKNGETVVLRRSFSQWTGPDKDLRQWVKVLRRHLPDAAGH
jgi:hypothetical protein